MNSHIKEFLEKYVSDPCPNYAVLIKGEWGSGKTYYAKKITNELVEKYNKQIADKLVEEYNEEIANKLVDEFCKKIAYVSLYGVDKLSQIDDIIMTELYPSLQTLKFLGKATLGVAKFIATETLSKVTTSKIAESVVEGTTKAIVDQKEKKVNNLNLPKPKDTILIFDDLERSSILIETIMGYINYFVEHQDCKVLILANEDKLKNPEIMEKTVGKVFTITAEIDSAYNEFIKNEQYKNIFTNYKNLIINIFKKSGFNNLRIIKQSFSDFNMFYNKLEEEIRSKQDLIEHLITLFFIFSFECKYNADTFKGLIKYIDNEVLQSLTNTETDKLDDSFKNILDKYNTAYLSALLLNNDYWVEIIADNKYDKEALNSSLKKSVYFYEAKNWQKFVAYSNLTLQTFPKLLETVLEEFKEEKLEIYAIIKVSHFLYGYSENKIIELSKDKITEIAKQALKKKVDAEPDFKFEHWSYNFSDDDTRELVDYLKELIDMKSMSKDRVNSLLQLMSEDRNKFIDELYSTYFNIPILSQINHSDFVNTLLKLEFFKIDFILRGLFAKFAPNQISLSKHEFTLEREWADKVIQEMEYRLKDSKTPLLLFEKEVIEELKSYLKVGEK